MCNDDWINLMVPVLVGPAGMFINRDLRAEAEVSFGDFDGSILAFFVFADGPVVRAYFCDIVSFDQLSERYGK
jgi:hypothetical protein